MPGPYHEGWRHVRYEGDEAEAKRHVPLARKVLGFAVQEANRNGLLTYQHEYRDAERGLHITGEVIGGQPRVTIRVAPVPTPRRPPVRIDDGFVVWARTGNLPNGIDPVHPQQFLQPEWRTFFYDDEIAGYAAFPLDKGTYSGDFPEGLTHAGNVDWLSAAGERVSWYGPSSRYWYDDFRRPRAQYGKHVFQLGAILLDVDAYCEASDVDFAERYVLGAAKRGGRLFVVMAALPLNVVYPAPPEAAAESPDAWAAPSYPIVDIPVALRSFALVADPEAAGVFNLRAANGSAETHWAGLVARGVAPWHFDARAGSAVTHVPPESAQLFERGETLVRPSESNARLQLTRSDSGAWGLSTSSVRLEPGPGAAVIAEDNGETLEVVRAATDFDADALHYRIGGSMHVAFLAEYGGQGAPRNRYVRRQIIWADIRQGVLLLWSDSVVLDAGVYRYSAALVLCRGGTERVLWSDGNNTITFGSGDAIAVTLARLNEAPLAPLALAHLLVFGVITGAGGGNHNAQIGLLHANYFLPFRKADTYGRTQFAFVAGGWSNGQNKADVARDIGANTQVDNLGHTTLPGFAALEKHVAFSYQMNAAINGRRIVLNEITGSTLEALTGVAGVDRTESGVLGNDGRYHPIWPLGALPARTE